MRICTIAYTHYEFDGRVRRYAESMVSQGHSVEVFTLQHGTKGRTENLCGVQVNYVQRRHPDNGNKWNYLFQILVFIIRCSLQVALRHVGNRYDLIHAHSIPDFIVLSALGPRIFGTPVILDIHDILPELYANNYSTDRDSIGFRVLTFIEWVSCRIANHVIIANDIWRERLISRGSVMPEKCTTILNYPDPKFFRKYREKQKSNRFILMFPGTISRLQGLDIAVRAMVEISKRRADIDLHIYGGGPAENELVQLVRQFRLDDRVLFFASVPLEQLPEKVIDADLAVVPKRAKGFPGEAFSTKILEFMAMGVPVLVSRTRVDQYYFDESKVAFFEPENERDFAEKVLALAGDVAWREKLSKNGLAYIEQNNWNVKETLYLRIVSKLYSTRP